MQLPDSNRYLNNFVAIASFQLFELSMETLPVGLISMNEDGIILVVDAWAERILGYETGTLKNKHIGTVFSDNGRTFIDLVQTKGPGYIGRKRVKTCAGTEIQVEVAMTAGIEKHLRTLQIVFTLFV